jgi:predicted dehydrogenase
MRFLIIGLGSMGKRRIRNLKSLGHNEIAGIDPREDRRTEASDKFGITSYSDLNQALQIFKPDVFIISTPPNLHMYYAYLGLANEISCFIEASVMDGERIRDLGVLSKNSKIVIVPSCTMRYFDGPKKVKEILQLGTIGKVLNVNYQTGQYLPDWHPWEDVEDFYVSKREMGGAREIVSFELTWLNDIFGAATPISCYRGKLTSIDVDIDDIYHFVLRYENNVIANITVEVISQPIAVRELRILGSKGQLTFSGEKNTVRIITSGMANWEEIHLESGTCMTDSINPEEPYILEMTDFIAAVESKDADLFPNSLESDFEVLQTLNSLEKLSEGK